MSRFATLLSGAALAAVLFAVPSAAAPPQSTSDGSASQADVADEKTMSVWMEKKLIHSQAILRGLAMGDLDSVQYNAGRLKLLNRVEGFVRRANPDYRAHLNMFSRVSAEIERQAEAENIEGATLAFNQLTVSCVQCHKTLRGEGGPIDSAKPIAR